MTLGSVVKVLFSFLLLVIKVFFFFLDNSAYGFTNFIGLFKEYIFCFIDFLYVPVFNLVDFCSFFFTYLFLDWYFCRCVQAFSRCGKQVLLSSCGVQASL